MPTSLIYIKSFFIILPLNDASGDIVGDEGSSQVSPEAKFTSPLYTFTSPLQQTLKQNHRASHNWYIVKNMLNFLVFKWLLDKPLLKGDFTLEGM